MASELRGITAVQYAQMGALVESESDLLFEIIVRMGTCFNGFHGSKNAMLAYILHNDHSCLAIHERHLTYIGRDY